jgi:hypothetical protein
MIIAKLLYANYDDVMMMIVMMTITRVSQMKTVKKFLKFNLLNESGTQLYHFST